MADEANEVPPDPVTDLMSASAQQHEMYLAWVAAGFTETQALELLETFITALVQKS